MPRSPAQNEALRSVTRERVLRAALTLFARDGFAETSVRRIAQEAGVALGLLYAHFDGKEALLQALFEQGHADAERVVAPVESTDPRERLAAVVRGAVATVRANVEFWRLGYVARTQPAARVALARALGSRIERVLATLEGCLTELGSPDPRLDALALFAQLDGLCEHFALSPREWPVDAVAERVIARWTAPLPP